MIHLLRHTTVLSSTVAASALLLATASWGATRLDSAGTPDESNPTHQPGLTVIADNGRDPWTAPQLSSALSVTVAGPIARGQLLQVFDNPSDETVDAIYHFPLAPSTTVTGLSMTVGEKHYEGSLKPRKQASAQHSQSRSDLHTTSLLQTDSAGVSLRVANLGPGQTVEIAIRYLQEVALDGKWRSLHFPVSQAPSDSQSQASVAGVEADGGPWLHAEFDFDARDQVFNVQSPTHELDSFPEQDGSTVARLRYGPLLADRHLVVRWQQPEEEVSPMLFEQLSSGERFALWQPTQSPIPARSGAREVVFVVDCTASMYGEALAQARHALQNGLLQLTAEDTFNVVVLNDQARTLFAQPMPADSAHLQRARALSDQLQAQGSGPLLAALRLAHAKSPAASTGSEQPLARRRAIVLLSDGESMTSKRALQQINAHRLEQPLFSVGLGSNPNLNAGVAAARLGNGAFFHAATVGVADPALPHLFAKLGTASLSDAQVHFEGAPQAQAFPDMLTTLWSGDRPTVIAQLGEESMAVALRGRRANGQWVRTVQDASGGRLFDGLHRVWAARKLQFAEDETLRSQKPCGAPCQRGLANLALHHGILSPLTSWLVSTPTPDVPTTGQVVVLPMAPAAGSAVSAPDAPNDPGEPTCQLSEDPSSQL